MTTPETPLDIIYIDDAVLEFDRNRRAIAIDNEILVDRLFTAEALIIASPKNIVEKNNSFYSLLEEALNSIPFYIIAPKVDKPATEMLLKEKATIFDRLVLQEGEKMSIDPIYRIPAIYIREIDLNAILSLVRQDLINDHAPYRNTLASGNSDMLDYWNERGKFFGFDARAVCLDSESRRTNKEIHELQLRLISGAVNRAMEQVSRTRRKLCLMDYGCGIGRFYPYLKERFEYFGVDLAPSMIESAQKKFGGASFMVTDEIDPATIPDIDIFLFVDVLHHCTADAQRKAFEFCKQFAGERSRLILLENFIKPNSEPSPNQRPCSIKEIFTSVSKTFERVCTLEGIHVFGYPPFDYLQRSALLELDVHQ
jgi:SAM-dependent methyltransferase